jgi:hypothetical protein
VLGLVVQDQRPPGLVAAGPADVLRPGLLVQLDHLLAGVGGRRLAQRPGRRAEAREQPCLAALGRHRQPASRRRVAEALVDAPLAGPQHRQRLDAGLAHVAQLAVHEPGEQAAPPVCRSDRDERDVRGRHHCTGDGDVAGLGAGGRHDLRTVGEDQCAFRLEHGLAEARLVGRVLLAEGPPEQGHHCVVLVGGGGAQLQIVMR